MAVTFTVSLANIIKELTLETLYMPGSPEEVLISSRDVSRPGLEFTGFFEYYDNTRVLIIGNTEHAFLARFSPEERYHALSELLSRRPPAIIISRNLEPFEELMATAKENDVPILRTADTTSSLVAALVSYMNVELAPRITRHGVLVEVYGEGLLLVGDSGVGKSETAIELIKRGHRLIADDAVEIRKVSTNSLVGTAPKLIRNYIELRGIGIVNVAKLFGMGAVRTENEINLIVNIVPWNTQEVYDRLGLEEHYTTLLDVQVPTVTIPVKPGRSLAIIIEVAAMNNRQKKMGFNAAKAFTEQLDAHFGLGAE